MYPVSQPLSVIKSIIVREHPALGHDTVVEEYNESSSTLSSFASSKEPLELSVDPLLLQSINPSLEQSLVKYGVKCSTSMDKGMLIFSPTGESRPNWHQECNALVSQSLSGMKKETIKIPRETAEAAIDILASLKKEQQSLVFETSADDTDITIAGESSSVLQALDSLQSEVVEIPMEWLDPEDFDFLEQVKQHDFPPNIKCSFNKDEFTVVLKGPMSSMVKQSFPDLAKHETIPVILDPILIDFFKTPTGRSKLEGFLRGKKCRATVHIAESQSPTPLLSLLCDPDDKEIKKVTAVASHLPQYVENRTILIPDTIAHVVIGSKEFIQLCRATEKKHEVLIKQVGHEVTAAGFKAQVPGSVTDMESYFKAKAHPSLPLEIPVLKLVARCIERNQSALKRSIPRYKVDLSIETGRGIIKFSPTYNMNPEWEGEFKSAVSEYIQSNILHKSIVIPEKASSDIFQVLLSSEHNDNTFVFTHSSTSVSFAGTLELVESVEVRINEICSNHGVMNESIPLDPEFYEFLRQVKLQSMKKKFRSINIKLVRKNCSLTVSGPAKEVKKVKDEYVPSLVQRLTSVPVRLNKALIPYLASEKGREKLLSFVHQKQCEKCAIYTSESPAQLSLICTQKHQDTANKLSNAIVKSTSKKLYEIPVILRPFFPELPEFIRITEEEFSAMITVEGNSIVIAGFNDGVSKAWDMVSELVQNKRHHFQPLSIPIDPMIAKCIEYDLENLQSCALSLHVKCSVEKKKNKTTIVVSPTRETEPGWKEKCNEQIKLFIDGEYRNEVVPFAQEAIEDIGKILSLNKDLIFKGSEDGESAILVGERSAVEEVKKQISSVCSQKQITRLKNLKHEDYDYFEQVVLKSLQGNVVFEFSPEKHSVSISGTIYNVLAMCTKLENLTYVKVPVFVEERVVRFISCKGKEKLNTLIQKSGIEAAIHIKLYVTPPTLEFLCEESLSACRFAESLPNQTSSCDFELPATITKQHLSQEVSKFCKGLTAEHCVLIEVKNDVVQICGFKEEISKVQSSIKEFVKSKCAIRMVVPIQKGMWQLLQGQMRKRWNEMHTACRDKGISIELSNKTGKELAIELKGDENEMQKVLESMKLLIQSICIVSVPLKTPQVYQFFEIGDGVNQIPGIERKMSVIIEMYITEGKEVREHTSRNTKISEECSAKVVDMKYITVNVGDITEFGADVIVNAANEELNHIGGLAYTILKKGGKEIQDACNDHVKYHGKLSAGDAWLSKVVGKLPCSALIHAVGPRWAGNPAWKEQLGKVVSNCLVAAKDYKSVAFPAISSGVFGCPIDQCAKIMVSATVEFFRSQRSAALNTISIVLFKVPNVSHFIKALEAHLPSQNIQKRASIPSPGSSSPRASAQPGMPSPQALSPKIGLRKEETGGSSLSRVCIKEGSLLDVKVRSSVY